MTERAIDTVAFFEALAAEMNAHPEKYEILGDVSMRIAIVMNREPAPFRIRLDFEAIECAAVSPIEAGDERVADCWIEGDLVDWQAMFDDILAHGQASGRQTINSLTLLGDHIAVHGDDPLGVDLFFRYNQTVQAYLDGAARVAVAA